jgi:serine/threonine-protein phosphatase 2A regulatory subunit B
MDPDPDRVDSVDWRFCQVFGDNSSVEEIQEPDVISSVELDKTGNYIAAGDRGGRVVVFERVESSRMGRARRTLGAPNVEYRFHTEFQSHEQEFDYLRQVLCSAACIPAADELILCQQVA